MRSSNAVVLSMNSTDYDNNKRWDASVLLRKLEKLLINKKFEGFDGTDAAPHPLDPEGVSFLHVARSKHSFGALALCQSIPCKSCCKNPGVHKILLIG